MFCLHFDSRYDQHIHICLRVIGARQTGGHTWRTGSDKEICILSRLTNIWSEVLKSLADPY